MKIPRDRVAVLIGRDGATKEAIERAGDVRIHVDSREGEVTIEGGSDPLKAVISESVVQAIGRGFNPSKAMYLFNENWQLIIISLREFARPGSRRIEELRGRIIGREGKTRRIIEELTSTFISVYGDTVSIIGDYISVQYSKEAVEMLINGRRHRTVYRFLEQKVGELKARRIEETFG